MSLKVEFLERCEGDSPSIERVFRRVAVELEASGVTCRFRKAPYGNTIFSTFRNLLFFRSSSADVFHITGHINYMGLVLPKEKTVLTVHDLTVLQFRSGFRRWLIARLYFKWPARRLRYLTAISEATKARLVTLAKISAEKVIVIENPLLISEARGRQFDPVMPTILQIGTAPNKNLDRLIKALEAVPCNLRIVGPIPQASRGLLEASGISYTNDLHLDDEGIKDAYRNADIVTLCSTDEGFGLPIIEAQACGVVVVTSDRSPMREVAGGAAALADPENPASIRASITALINDRALREDLVSKGRENVKRFNVKRIAAEYRTLYSEIANSAG
ncbi:MAG TPA: glycosyltransferase family 1 protein [Pyrinomonadaceae bacterium]